MDTGNRPQEPTAVEAGRAINSDPGASISTPANSEALRSTPNRVQERSNYQPALRCSSSGAGVNRMRGWSGIVQEANALANPRDMLTWTRSVEW